MKRVGNVAQEEETGTSEADKDAPPPDDAADARCQSVQARARSKESQKRRRRKGPRIEPPTSDEVLEAYRFLDPAGQGFVSKEGVVQVFKTLLGRDLSDHEVEVMLGFAQAVADSRRGRIELPAFQNLVSLIL